MHLRDQHAVPKAVGGSASFSITPQKHELPNNVHLELAAYMACDARMAVQ